jgi:predicted RNA polymerase sigma factor
MARLSRAIALAMVNGAFAGLRELEHLASDPALADSHRLHAARAHLLERAGRHAHAVESYQQAANRTTSTADRHYLLLRAAKLSTP